jgi:hypothetical protein
MWAPKIRGRFLAFRNCRAKGFSHGVALVEGVGTRCSRRRRLRWSRFTIAAGLGERILGNSNRSNAGAILERVPSGSPEMRSMPTVGLILFCLQTSNSTAVNSSYQAYRDLPLLPFVDCRLLAAARQPDAITPALRQKSCRYALAASILPSAGFAGRHRAKRTLVSMSCSWATPIRVTDPKDAISSSFFARAFSAATTSLIWRAVYGAFHFARQGRAEYESPVPLSLLSGLSFRLATISARVVSRSSRHWYATPVRGILAILLCHETFCAFQQTSEVSAPTLQSVFALCEELVPLIYGSNTGNRATLMV